MFLTVSQYAKKIGKSRFTIYLWIKEGKLPDGVTVTNVCGRILIDVPK